MRNVVYSVYEHFRYYGEFLKQKKYQNEQCNNERGWSLQDDRNKKGKKREKLKKEAGVYIAVAPPPRFF